MRYIELNPVRAGMVTKPEDYRWPSHRHHIAVSTIDWLPEPEEYRRLAASPKASALAYQVLFKQALSAHEIEAIRTHLNKGCVLGSTKFQDETETILQRRTKIAPLGRPKKVKGIIMN